MDGNFIVYGKSNGYWIRIPLLIKKVMDNGFEFHNSIKK